MEGEEEGKRNYALKFSALFDRKSGLSVGGSGEGEGGAHYTCGISAAGS